MHKQNASLLEESKGRNSIFFRTWSCCISNFIDECSNMGFASTSEHPPLPPYGWGQKVKPKFSEHSHVAYQIKWDYECCKMEANILSFSHHSTPEVTSEVKTFFSEISQVAYQIRREWIIEHNESTYSVLTHTLDHWGGVKCQNIFILNVVKNSEYDQEIPQSQTADNPVAPRGRAAQPSRDTRKTN